MEMAKEEDNNAPLMLAVVEDAAEMMHAVDVGAGDHKEVESDDDESESDDDEDWNELDEDICAVSKIMTRILITLT